MSEVSMNIIEYSLKTRSLNQKIQHIHPSPAAVETGASNVSAMKKFVRLYEELGDMLREYQELLECDQNTLEKVKTTFVNQDVLLSRLWK